ncbi:MAG: ABC transporter substrate-binding protein [Burkholderiales bacterium]
MSRRRFIVRAIALGVAVAAVRTEGQPTRRLPRVAFVTSFSEADGKGPDPVDESVRAFVHGLRDLGLVDGRDIVVERHSIQGRIQQVPAVMQDLVRRGVDVIVTEGGPAVWAAHRATDRIAIVGVVDEVLDMQIIDSLARPGHNFTGIGEYDTAIHAKRLQILKEAVPAISRVAVICYHQGPNDRGRWRADLESGARGMKLDVLWVGVDTPEEYAAGFATIVRRRADAIYVTSTHVNDRNAKLIAEFALKHRLPSFGFAEQGMLLSYWSESKEVFGRVAVLVKKILDGARPGDLPFEQPTKFALIVNQKTARALGVTLPRALLLRATEIIQ